MLILLLRLFIFASITLWSFITRLIFSTIASLLVLLIRGFAVPGEAFHGGFRQLTGAIRAGFELFWELIMEAMNFMVTKAFDVVKESVTGSVGVTGFVINGVAEKMKNSFEESLNYLAEFSEEISGMVTKMVAELWNNFNDAVGYVTQNIA